MTENKPSLEGWVQIPGRLFLTLVGGLLLAGILGLFTLGAWVIEIRSNRFTAGDGATLEVRMRGYHERDQDRLTSELWGEVRTLRDLHNRP